MNHDLCVTETIRWDVRFLGLEFWLEVDRDSRLGRFLERRGF